MLRHRLRSSCEDRSQDGFILVATLWLLAALAALVVIFSQYVSSSARALRAGDETLQADALISAGTELTAYRLLRVKDEDRPKKGGFRIRLGDDEIAVSFVTEAARIDLNAAPKELIENLCLTLGADADAAKGYAERIVAWRSKPADNTTAQAEEALYASAGRKYAPRLAAFAHVDELALVQGPPPWLVERMMPFVTVYSGDPGVDAQVAAPEVVAALPGMTPLLLKDFLASRDSLPSDPAAIAKALGPAGTTAAPAKSKAWRLRIVASAAAGWRHASTVVIAPTEKEGPYRVLSRQDEGPQARNARAGRQAS